MNKKFILLWIGELISAIGSGITSFGLGVYVFQTTGSAAAMSLVTLLAFLPGLILSPIAGILADKYDRRLLMILGDSLSALGLVFILVVLLQGEAKLWQICVGVLISSIFSSLLEPAYKATVTDLLPKEEYAKASGLVQMAGSSKYLLSPIIAGFLLTVSDIKLLLVIDILTFFVTVVSTFVVRRGLASKVNEDKTTFREQFKVGLKAIAEKKGIMFLIVIASVMTFFIGFIQTLSTPMVLSFSDSSTLGVVETICASGMLVSSVLIGLIGFKKGYVKMLYLSLLMAGVFMMVFGLRENIVLICIAGFLFFTMLPFANTGIDYLVRTNIDNSVQGRAWGLIGIISQLGYVFAYAFCGVLSDYVFEPLLASDGLLANSVGKITGVGDGRGIGLLIIIAGFMLIITSVILAMNKSVKSLENKQA